MTEILLIDDDEIDVVWIDGCLKAARTPYELIKVDSIQNAISALKTLSVEVILMDIRMFENFQKERDTILDLTHAPLIILGDWEHANLDIETLDTAITDYLPKPLLTPILLSHAIKYAIKHATSEQKLLKLAHFDPLTGAANRRLFLDRFDQSILLVQRKNLLAGLILIDLDEFKPINDKYGHDAGDQLLKEFTSRVKNTLRKSDTLARLGGDEFAILLPEIDSREMLIKVAEKVLDVIQQPVLWKGEPLAIKASMGLVVYPDEKLETNSTEIYKTADTTLYEAKKSGKNIFKIYN